MDYLKKAQLEQLDRLKRELFMLEMKDHWDNADFSVEAYKKENNTKYTFFDFDTTMFPQVWGSTCTGFDIATDGSPAISGCAMTKEYTTILCETLTGSYVVCFGDKPCYKVTNPNEDFINDMRQHCMVGLQEAKGRY